MPRSDTCYGQSCQESKRQGSFQTPRGLPLRLLAQHMQGIDSSPRIKNGSAVCLKIKPGHRPGSILTKEQGTLSHPNCKLSITRCQSRALPREAVDAPPLFFWHHLKKHHKGTYENRPSTVACLKQYSSIYLALRDVFNRHYFSLPF